MEDIDILDEKIPSPSIRSSNPIVIRFFVFFVCAALVGALLKIQSWPYASPTLYFAHFGTIITGAIAFFTGAFHPPKKKDNYIRFCFLLFWLGLMAQYANNFLSLQNPSIATFLRFLTPLFMLSNFLLLLRYYTTERQYNLAFDVLKIPLMLLAPCFYVGLFLKYLSRPYASETITTSILCFVLITFLSFAYKVFIQKKKGKRILAFLAVLSTNIFMFGVLFKIQAWPFASELLTMSVLGIVVIVLLHYLTKKSSSS